MSLSWLERLQLFVHPQRVVLERQAWRGPVERLSHCVAPAAVDAADWQPALTVAGALLAAHPAAGARLQVVIANPFVRYALLPWSEAVMGDRARLALARALLRNTLGEQVAAYEIALDRAVFGRNGLAGGVQRGLLDGLRQAAKANRLRLGSLQPQLTGELSIHRPVPSDGCIAFTDDGWLTLLGLQAGNYSLLRNHRTAIEASAVQNELLSLLATGTAAVNAKKLLIFSEEKWPETLGDWQIDPRPPRFTRLAHA